MQTHLTKRGRNVVHIGSLILLGVIVLVLLVRALVTVAKNVKTTSWQQPETPAPQEYTGKPLPPAPQASAAQIVQEHSMLWPFGSSPETTREASQEELPGYTPDKTVRQNTFERESMQAVPQTH
jgi:hypothetical protein